VAVFYNTAVSVSVSVFFQTITISRLCSFPIMPGFPNGQQRLFYSIVCVWIFVWNIFKSSYRFLMTKLCTGNRISLKIPRYRFGIGITDPGLMHTDRDITSCMLT